LAACLGLLACLIAPAYGAGGRPIASKSSGPYPIRGVYDRDRSSTGFSNEAAIGFNYIDSGPYRDEMRALAAHHLKGLIWLGGYDKSTCRFSESDGWVRSHVSAIAGSPAVGGYYVADEPDAARCPRAPAQMRARAALVKSIDPRPPTLLVTYRLDQLRLFAGTVDVIGLDHYPCSYEDGCRYALIDREAAAADRLGIRYWGIIQAFGDDYYKQPTSPQLYEEFVHWRATKMQGYLVFAWRWPRNKPSMWLANHAQLRTQLAKENAS
jgi:hypothetical protein